MNLDPDGRGLAKANRSLAKLRAKTTTYGEEEGSRIGGERGVVVVGFSAPESFLCLRLVETDGEEEEEESGRDGCGPGPLL